MNNNISHILSEYLKFFSNEEERQSIFKDYIAKHNIKEMIDWNNFEGHIVASGFVYAKKERKFLVIYHNDLKRYIYPGGHVDVNDENVLETAKREVKEETGLDNLKELEISEDEIIPIDIDTHRARYNERLNLPEHYHFDFRYLFIIDKISNVKIDETESSSYKWIDIKEFKNNLRYSGTYEKLVEIIDKNN